MLKLNVETTFSWSIEIKFRERLKISNFISPDSFGQRNRASIQPEEMHLSFFYFEKVSIPLKGQ